MSHWKGNLISGRVESAHDSEPWEERKEMEEGRASSSQEGQPGPRDPLERR